MHYVKPQILFECLVYFKMSKQAAQEILLVLGDKIPLVSEAVFAILSYAPGGSPKKSTESKRRRDGINAYANALRNLWIKAFGER